MAKKNTGNTVEYRQLKRVTAFINPNLKRIILAAAKKNERSVSEEIGEWLAVANQAKKNA